jgi:bacterial/archaeal transporter family-2 protein
VTKALIVGVMLLVGGLLAFQPPVNAQLARHTGVIGATFISSVMTTAILTVVLVAAGGGFAELRHAGGVPLVYLTGGMIGAVVIVGLAASVGSLGAGGVFAATICGQLLVSAAVVDRFALAGVDRVGLSAPRLIGIALVVVGTLLITLR